MVALADLRRVYGHVVERATLARDLLAPVASQLSGDPAGVHSRCVLAQQLGLMWRPEKMDDLRADLAPFGAMEAIAFCQSLGYAVIVFRDEASVAVTVRRQEEIRFGLYSAVPPPHLALPRRFIHPDRVKVNLFPSTPSTAGEAVVASEESSTQAQATVQPRTGADDTPSTPLWMESRPAMVFQNHTPDEKCMGRRPAPGTSITRFVPSRKSLIHGPTLGADGHLWMEGDNVTEHDKGYCITPASVRVVQVPQLQYQY